MPIFFFFETVSHILIAEIATQFTKGKKGVNERARVGIGNVGFESSILEGFDYSRSRKNSSNPTTIKIKNLVYDFFAISSLSTVSCIYIFTTRIRDRICMHVCV